MKDYQIISDSSCDFTLDEVKRLDVRIVYFYISMDAEKYQREVLEIDIPTFFQTMVDHPTQFPKTSLPTVEDFYRAFQASHDEGKDVLCITITTKFSGSYNAALAAKKMWEEEDPSFKIEIIDSQVNTILQGLVVREAVRMKQQGFSLEKSAEVLNEIKKTGRIYFTVNGLSYLQHGGRIGKVSAIIGNILKINPLIILKNGEIQSGGIALSRKRAILKTIEKLKATFTKYALNFKDYLFAIGYCHNRNEAKEYKKDVEEVIGKPVDYFGQIGAAIAVHTGPHALGLAFIKKFDV